MDQTKTIEANQKQMIKTDALLRDQKMEIDKNAKEFAASIVRYRKLNDEKIHLQEECENLKKEIKNKRNELKVEKLLTQTFKKYIILRVLDSCRRVTVYEKRFSKNSPTKRYIRKEIKIHRE